MRSLIFGILAALCLQATACSSDDGEPEGGPQGNFGVVLENTQAEADLAARAACNCSGTATAEQCAGAKYDSEGLMFPPCYVDAFNAAPAAVDTVTACAKAAIQRVQAQYEAQAMCGQAGIDFALLQLSDAVVSCARTDATLQPKFDACDGAPPAQ